MDVGVDLGGGVEFERGIHALKWMPLVGAPRSGFDARAAATNILVINGTFSSCL